MEKKSQEATYPVLLGASYLTGADVCVRYHPPRILGADMFVQRADVSVTHMHFSL